MLLNFTTINHTSRIKLGLTMNEYAVADLIYHLSNNPKGDIQGWCYASKQKIGQILCLSEQSVHSIINKLIAQDLVVKSEETKHLKASKKWYENVIIDDTKESLATLNHLDKNTKETLVGDTKETLDNIYNNKIYNNNINKKVKKDTKESECLEILKHWNETYGTKYKSIEGFSQNATKWLNEYTLEEIKKSISQIKYHTFWRDKMSIVTFFRKKNPQGEAVDYIGEMLNSNRKETPTQNQEGFSSMGYRIYRGK